MRQWRLNFVWLTERSPELQTQATLAHVLFTVRNVNTEIVI